MVDGCRMKWLACVAGVLVALTLSATAFAAPFSISYTGVISDSTFAEIFNGQPYRVTVVVDNGLTTASDQTWTKADLQCVIFRMNTTGNVSFAQNLAATNDLDVIGSMNTNGSGALTSNFSEVNEDNDAPPGTYSASGFSPQPAIDWFLNQNNEVFDDNTRKFDDLSGGVQMAPANWTNPQPFAGTCAASGLSGLNVSAPLLSGRMEIFLTSLLAICGLAVLRRRTARN